MEPVRTGTARPITGRPLTSAAATHTGLTAPKSSRGKTGLRRQIQDKSYFIGLLRMKINELNGENNTLLRECEIMSKEEARIGVYRQKAEVLARELNELTLDLLTYNEFVDRTRIDDDVATIKEDTNEIKHENEALMANLENDYAKLRSLEDTIKHNDEKMKEVQNLINAAKSKLSEPQLAEFNLIQTINADLSKECHLLEQEISMWRSKKNEIEEKTVKDGNLLKMELMKAVSKLRSLEKQKDKLLNVGDSEENERKNLLAQVKRDNNYINSLKAKMEDLNILLANMKSEIEFYKDSEKMSKLSDLKNQDKLFDEFTVEYNAKKQSLMEELESINNEINDTSNKLSRSLRYLNLLKRIRNDTNSAYDVSNELIVQKRKLELEIFKSKQSKEKAEAEKESLIQKIAKLGEEIKSYSDVNVLKSQVETKLENVKQESSNVKHQIQQFKLDLESMNSEIRELLINLEKDESYKQIVKLETELKELLRTNEKLKEKDNRQMIVEMKTMVMEMFRKYNQNLMGF